MNLLHGWEVKITFNFSVKKIHTAYFRLARALNIVRYKHPYINNERRKRCCQKNCSLCLYAVVPELQVGKTVLSVTLKCPCDTSKHWKILLLGGKHVLLNYWNVTTLISSRKNRELRHQVSCILGPKRVQGLKARLKGPFQTGETGEQIVSVRHETHWGRKRPITVQT